MTTDAFRDALTQFDWTRAICGDPALTATDRGVALTLLTYANHDGTRVFPGIENIAAGANVSESTAKRSVKKLTAERYLRVVVRGRFDKASEYRLTIPVARLHMLSDDRIGKYGVERNPPEFRDPWDPLQVMGDP